LVGLGIEPKIFYSKFKTQLATKKAKRKQGEKKTQHKNTNKPMSSKRRKEKEKKWVGEKRKRKSGVKIESVGRSEDVAHHFFENLFRNSFITMVSHNDASSKKKIVRWPSSHPNQ
jgi:hypothetical protein